MFVSRPLTTKAFTKNSPYLTTTKSTTTSLFTRRLPQISSRSQKIVTTRGCSRGFDEPLTKEPKKLSVFAAPLIVPKLDNLEAVEEELERVVYRCRFLAILGVFGSLIGSFLCFIKGCTYVMSAFVEYFATRTKVIILLVEAIDVYLLGTVMLVFGMGLYELFVSTLDTAKLISGDKESPRSTLFGMFTLKERPQWLEIKSVNQLKTKLGHVIVMLLLIGFFEKSKTAAIQTPLDLLYFAASVLLCSGCLYLLSTLKETKR